MAVLTALALFFAWAADARGDDQPLFDGRTLRGWTMVEGSPVAQGWEVVNGMIHLKPSEGPRGHIVTDREFDDFDLIFKWKIPPGGNNGLKYLVREYSLKISLLSQLYD